jgi:hypothetical protein
MRLVLCSIGCTGARISECNVGMPPGSSQDQSFGTWVLVPEPGTLGITILGAVLIALGAATKATRWLRRASFSR